MLNYFVVYFISFLFGVFVVVPCLRARYGYFQSSWEINEAVLCCFIWPFVGIYFTVKEVSIWLFSKSEKFFTPKPKLQSKVDETKSTYRKIEFMDK